MTEMFINTWFTTLTCTHWAAKSVTSNIDNYFTILPKISLHAQLQDSVTVETILKFSLKPLHSIMWNFQPHPMFTSLLKGQKMMLSWQNSCAEDLEVQLWLVWWFVYITLECVGVEIGPIFNKMIEYCCLNFGDRYFMTN